MSVLAMAAACTSSAHVDAPAQHYQPTGAQAPWVITGHLDETVIDFGGDETVTIKINDQLAAIGGFESHRGAADASFVGAFRGDKITVHCTGTDTGKGFLCEVQRGSQYAATLRFETP